MSLDNNSTKLIDSSDNNQKSNNCDLNTETKGSPVDGTSSLNGIKIDSNCSVDTRQHIKIENNVNDNNTNESKGQFMEQKDKSDGGSDVSSDGNKNDGYGILKNGVPDLGKILIKFSNQFSLI